MMERAPRATQEPQPTTVTLRPGERVVSKNDIVISRRDLLKRGGIGAAVLAGAAFIGKNKIEGDVRSKFIAEGDLEPELGAELEKTGTFYLDTQGWTVDSLRESGWDIDEFPLALPKEDQNFESSPSDHNWLGVWEVAENGLYLPSDGEVAVGDLTRAGSSVNNALRKVDNRLRFVSGDVIDFLEAENAYNVFSRGKTLFDMGHVVTGTRVEFEGKTHGIAIGRTAVGEPISYITFDASDRATPLPEGVVPGGLIVQN